MKFCIYCGKQLRDEDQFCAFCGKPQSAQSNQAAQNEPEKSEKPVSESAQKEPVAPEKPVAETTQNSEVTLTGSDIALTGDSQNKPVTENVQNKPDVQVNTPDNSQLHQNGYGQMNGQMPQQQNGPMNGQQQAPRQ